MLLLHKNDVVADVLMVSGSIINVNKLYNKELLPVGTYNDYKNLLANQLSQWMKTRAIPSERQNISQILSALNQPISDALMKSFAVSLTDCYWIKNGNSKAQWENVNYYKNGFSDDFVPIIYDGLVKINDYRLPDLTTDGVLKKAWVSLSGVPTLLKTGKLGPNANDKHLLSANEVVAYQVANLMGIDHVEYYPIRVENSVICATPCFIQNDKDEFVSALQIMKEDKSFRTKLYDNFVNRGLKADVDKMILFDHILHNTDRHERNFGIIRDSDTLDTVSFAPLFDSGSCLGWNHTDRISKSTKPFSEDREEQLSLIGKIPEIPSEKMIIELINDVYELYDIPENVFEIAKTEVKNSYEMLKKRDMCQYIEGFEEER